MTSEELYKALLGNIQTMLSETAFKMYFSQTKAGKLENESLEIICPNEHIKEQISKKFYSVLNDAASKIAKTRITFSFKIERKELKTKTEDLPLFSQNSQKKTQASTPSQKDIFDSNLSAKYTFENFIIGPSNRLAHAIALAITDNPGKVYNPFFLHAGVGLGKTHLIQAIGNQIIKNNPEAKIIYATAESFMNELIEAIQEGRNKNYITNKFRNKFRKADVLLIDDIQFIAGRGEATQEEFFHTFNALYMAQKQIVLTSDKPPKELSRLDVRITSRFASGVVADMQTPDLVTRSAILREKRDEMRLQIDNNIVDFIAENVEINVRELEGAFLQIVTMAKSENTEVTKDFCTRVLGLNFKKIHANVGVNEIIKTVCNYYSIKVADIKGKRRNKEVVIPRQISMYLMKEYSETPFMAIGDLLGGRDHTTIIHGHEKIGDQIKTDNKLKQDISNIERLLNISVDK